MIYAIVATVMALSIILCFVTAKREREVAAKSLSDEEYRNRCAEFASNMPLPTQGAVICDKKFKRQINTSRYLLKWKRYDGLFDEFTQKISALNVDLSALADTPSIKLDDQNVSRIVAIARFCLSHNDYKLSADRVLDIVNAQNKKNTLTFAEVMAMKEAFLYVYIEKLHYLFKRLRAISKVYSLCKKYCDNQNIAIFDKRYKSYVKSPLFLSMCAVAMRFDNEKYTKVVRQTIDCIYDEYAKLLNGMGGVVAYDFSRYYSPLEIYDKFDVFSSANENCKENFLKCAGRVSDKENIDEFLFAIRLEKYMSSASSGHIKVKRGGLIQRKVFVFSQKEDISMLAVALSSPYFMNLIFNEKRKNSGKSISKICDFENTFEPIYKFQSLNFGISTLGGRLKVSPHLPSGIVSADIAFEENGTVNSLKIERGEENALYLGNTKLSGTTQIKLSSKPLSIKVVVGDDAHKSKSSMK